MVGLTNIVTSRLINKLRKKVYGDDEIYFNVNRTSYSRNALLLYITTPFKKCRVPVSHQNQWQARELARLMGESGFNVDVIDYSARKVPFRHAYDLIIDLHPRMDAVYRDWLKSGCRRAAYITGSNPVFANAAEQRRIVNLEQRRGVRLQPRRHTPPFEPDVLNDFDGIMFIGNQYNLATYRDFSFKKTFLIKNTGYEFLLSEPLPDKLPVNFLFIASTGQVHKGLDLLLEAFSGLSGVRLFVCSKYHEESDFTAEYRRELFESPSVVPAGFLDITGEKFRKILSECSYILMPSCAEGLCGSVLTAMSAGLVPIVSRECGFADDEVIHLPDCGIDTIRRFIREYAGKSPAWLAAEGRRIKEIVRTRYSEEAFRQSVRTALAGIVEGGA